MSDIKLNNSGVVFNQEQHRYFLGSKELQGITSTLLRRAFPNQYSGIPDSVLAAAAERGSKVHEQIEILNSVYGGEIGEFPVSALSPELSSYACMVRDAGLAIVASEYIITDGSRFASSIDGVYTDADGNIVLVDYKTTHKIYYESVSLQLSIYARLFELQNPGLKVARIACMWMRDKESRFSPLPRVSEEALDKLFKAEIDDDDDYVYESEVPGEFLSLEERYVAVTRQMSALQLQLDEVKEKMAQFMKDRNAHSYRTAFGLFSYIPAGKKKRFDTTAFKKANPEEYDKYTKESASKAQLRITESK